MKLIDMKRPKRKTGRSKGIEASEVYDGERYPYGLRIRLERCQIDKLSGVEKLKTGDTVLITGEGKVISTRIEERERGGKDHTVEFQLERIGIEPKKSLKQMDMKEYQKARKK